MTDPPDRRDPAATRKALERAATALFAERGFDGTTTEQIARRAGVNKAMISYHFGGKHGLYAAILVSVFGALGERLRVALDSGEPAPAVLDRLFAAFAGMQREAPAVSAMILREVLSGGRHLDERILPRFLDIFASVRETVRRGVREGTLRPVDPFLTHLTLIGSIVFFFATTPFRERLIAEGKVPVSVPPTAEAFLGHLREIAMRGLIAQGDAPLRRES